MWTPESVSTASLISPIPRAKVASSNGFWSVKMVLTSAYFSGFAICAHLHLPAPERSQISALVSRGAVRILGGQLGEGSFAVHDAFAVTWTRNVALEKDFVGHENEFSYKSERWAKGPAMQIYFS